MKIDKTRFILLTSTLAASAAVAVVSTSGCTSTATQTDGGTQTTDSGTDGTTSDSSTDSGDSGGQCLDDTGNAPFCGPTGEGGDPDAGDDAGDGGTADAGPNSPTCRYECNQASENLKKGVANAVNDCLNKDKDEATCIERTKACVAEGLAKACDDATAKTYCTSLVAQCKGDAGEDDAGDDAGSSTQTPFTQQACEALVKALSAKGRENFTSCVTEGGTACIGRPGDCLDEFKVLATP
jgi:hypothetical protein